MQKNTIDTIQKPNGEITANLKEIADEIIAYFPNIEKHLKKIETLTSRT